MTPAWDKAIELLAIAEHSERDLTLKLKKRGYDEEEIRETVARLFEVGYLDNDRYAKAYIRRSIKGKSSRRIRQELSRKGIRPEDPDRLILEVYREEDCTERETLERLVERKLRGNPHPDEKELRRLFAFLQRRGFSYHDIASAIPVQDMA